jgi:hypothetical protein
MVKFPAIDHHKNPVGRQSNKTFSSSSNSNNKKSNIKDTTNGSIPLITIATIAIEVFTLKNTVGNEGKTSKFIIKSLQEKYKLNTSEQKVTR